VVVDKADTFLGAERNRLLSVPSRLVSNGTLEQAVVIVADERTEVLNQKPGVAYYAAQDGTITRLGLAQQEGAAA